MNMQKLSALLLVVSFLTGCASTQPKEELSFSRPGEDIYSPKKEETKKEEKKKTVSFSATIKKVEEKVLKDKERPELEFLKLSEEDFRKSVGNSTSNFFRNAGHGAADGAKEEVKKGNIFMAGLKGVGGLVKGGYNNITSDYVVRYMLVVVPKTDLAKVPEFWVENFLFQEEGKPENTRTFYFPECVKSTTGYKVSNKRECLHPESDEILFSVFDDGTIESIEYQ